MRGRTRCRLHGGASPIGVTHPSFTHGRYSRCLPPPIAKPYRAARGDPALLELRDGIALTDARICELLGMSEIPWPDVLDTLNVQRRLIATECRRMRDQAQYIRVEQAMALVGAVVAAVRRVCTSEQLAIVQADVRSLLVERRDDAPNA